jgi:hypothetical protein
MDNIYVTNKQYNMPLGIQSTAQSHQRFISITVIGDSVEVITDQSTKLYPCPNEHFARSYASRLQKMYLTN